MIAENYPITFSVQTFNASLSCVPSHTYSWDLGDGTTLTTTTPSVIHQYATAGPYNVSVRIEGLDTAQLDGTPTLFLSRTIVVIVPIPALGALDLCLLFLLLAFMGMIALR